MPTDNSLTGISNPSSLGSSSMPDLSSLSTGDLFGGSTASPFGSSSSSSLPAGYDPVTGAQQPSIWDNLNLNNLGGDTLGVTPSATGTPAATGQAGGSGLSSTLSGLLPTLAGGAVALGTTSAAQSENANLANQVAALGQPFTTAGQQQLAQFNSGQLRPDQQSVVDAYNTASSQITAGAGPLAQIAQTAFANYNSGQLSTADETRLQQQIASQKQQVRSRLAASGITDSSVLDAQDQQIDAQATMTRQSLLNAQFATGNQAYDTWLTTTAEGQQLRVAGQQFASQQFEQMLNDAMGLGAEGMQPAMQAVQMQIQSNQQLSQTLNSLLGNLASAYSYSQAGTKGGTAGGSPGLSQIINGVKTGTSVANTANTIFGNTDSGISSGWASGANANSILGEQGFGGATSTGADATAYGYDENVPGVGLTADPSFNGAGGQATGTVATNGAQVPGALQTANQIVGTGSSILGLYSGLKQGGVVGDTTAAVSAARLASSAGIVSGSVGAAAGYVAAPLAVYSAIQGYQSGDTKGDTIRGAEAGAAVGSAIFPGIGTAIGAAAGAVVGAISSWFGPGKPSAGQQSWDWYQKSGAMNQPGTALSTSQFEESWLGAWQSDNNRKYLSTFTNMSGSGSHGGDAEEFKGWVEDQLASGIKSGAIKKGETSADIYSKVITPAMDQYWKQTGSTMTSAQWAQQSAKGDLQLPQMITATIDRAMTGQQIGRVGENYNGVSGWSDTRKQQEYVPSLAELLGKAA